MRKFTALILAAVTAFAFTACGGGKEDVRLKYYNAASDMLPALKTENITVGLLPEPAATKLVGMNDKYSVAFDVQKLYGGDYPQAVVVAKKSVAEADSVFVDNLIISLQGIEGWVAENPAAAVAAVNSALKEGLIPSLDNTLTKATVENCNIYFESAVMAKNSVNAYLSAVKEIENSAANPLSNEFFYAEQTGKTENENGSYSLYVPDGAPALAVSKLINDNNMLGRKVNYNVVASSEIGPSVVQKKADVAILPVTAASKTIGSGENYVMLGVVTHGNLYIMSTEKFGSVKDLAGRTVGVIQQGQVPDLTFKAVLKKNGINYSAAD